MDKENSLKNRMFMKKYLSLAGTTVALSMGSISLLSEEAYAREWIATTDAQMITKVKAEDGQYTFEEGDTFWVIGHAINIQPFKLMEWNTFQVGSQYTVPIGTTIYWSGDQVTIKDAAGNVVYEKDTTDEDKIDPNKSVAFQSPNLPNTSGQTNNTVTKQKETHSNEKQPSFGKENGSSTPSIKSIDTKYDATIYYVDTEGTNIFPMDRVDVKKGEVYTAVARELVGYALLGNKIQTIEIGENHSSIIFVYEKNSMPIMKTSTVTINYVTDKEQTAEKFKVPVGELFEYIPKVLPGYQLRPDSLQSISEIIEGDRAFTFVYEKIKPVVTIYSVDKDGNRIDTETIEVPWGNELHFTPSAIPGYRLADDSLQSISEIIEGDRAFTFVYEKIKPVVTIYSVDKDGNRIGTETIEVPWGNEFHFTPRAIPGYRLTDDSLQSVSETIEGDQAFTFVYEKIKPVVTIYSMDKDGNMIDMKTIEVPWGNEFHFTPSEIPGYRLTTDSPQSIVEVIEENKNFTFIYEKIDPVVTIHSIDKNGKLLKTETFDVPSGTEFHYTPSEINGHLLATDSPQCVSEVIEEDKEFTFVYEKINLVVTIYYFDIAFETVLKTEKLTVPWGDELHHTLEPPRNYVLVDPSIQTIDEVIEENKEFTFLIRLRN